MGAQSRQFLSIINFYGHKIWQLKDLAAICGLTAKRSEAEVQLPGDRCGTSELGDFHFFFFFFF